MAKSCGFCDFRTDDVAAFTEHMRTVHHWGVAPAAAPAAVAPAVSLGADGAVVAKFCGNCGAPRDAASTNFCRTCGAAYASETPVARTDASPAFAPKGGFWRRTAAYLLDSVALVVIGAIVGAIVGGIGVGAQMRPDDINVTAQVLGNVLGLGYFLYFWSSRGAGQTPGMRVMKLRVVRTDGTYLSIGRAFLRDIGLGLSILALGIGVIWVAFDRNKQGWHDKIADTYVIKVTA